MNDAELTAFYKMIMEITPEQARTLFGYLIVRCSKDLDLTIPAFLFQVWKRFLVQ